MAGSNLSNFLKSFKNDEQKQGDSNNATNLNVVDKDTNINPSDNIENLLTQHEEEVSTINNTHQNSLNNKDKIREYSETRVSRNAATANSSINQNSNTKEESAVQQPRKLKLNLNRNNTSQSSSQQPVVSNNVEPSNKNVIRPNCDNSNNIGSNGINSSNTSTNKKSSL